MIKHYDIIFSSVVTEKSNNISAYRQYVFRVPLKVNKLEIKNAVEYLFNVKVMGVNTLRRAGKEKRFRGKLGKRSDIKNAIVTLCEGFSIDVTVGI